MNDSDAGAGSSTENQHNVDALVALITSQPADHANPALDSPVSHDHKEINRKYAGKNLILIDN